MANPISYQTGIRQYNGDLSQYTGMLGGLTPDVHTLRSLNPLTDGRVMVVMYRGPYFLMQYFQGDANNAYNPANEFGTYKKIIEYYNMGISCTMNDGTLASTNLQGGFAGRSISIPTVQNTNNNQTLTITVPELEGRPVANFHNMWIDGISDPITGLTHYQGLVAGSVDGNGTPQRIYAPSTGASTMALEPSPAWEVGEFLIIAVDRSGARVEAAAMALGCIPINKVGNDIFNMNNPGQSNLQRLQLSYHCQFVQSAYVNDLAARYLRQFAIFGNSLNMNPGAGDAFFKDASAENINTAIFNNGNRPTLDAVQSGLGNAPVFSASQQTTVRDAVDQKVVQVADHSQIYNSPSTTTSIANPYETTASPNS